MIPVMTPSGDLIYEGDQVLLERDTFVSKRSSFNQSEFFLTKDDCTVTVEQILRGQDQPKLGWYENGSWYEVDINEVSAIVR